ncbi:hypothetical protein Tco_0273950 [Tanacetum coccineum]
MDKGLNKEPSTQLKAETRVNTYAIKSHFEMADIENDIMDPVMQAQPFPPFWVSLTETVSFVTEDTHVIYHFSLRIVILNSNRARSEWGLQDDNLELDTEWRGAEMKDGGRRERGVLSEYHANRRLLGGRWDPTQVLKILKNDLAFDNSDLDHCEICQKFKQTREPFPLSEHKSSVLAELVHLDLWGPYKVASKEGFRFFLTIVDDYTRSDSEIFSPL